MARPTEDQLRRLADVLWVAHDRIDDEIKKAKELTSIDEIKLVLAVIDKLNYTAFLCFNPICHPEQDWNEAEFLRFLREIDGEWNLHPDVSGAENLTVVYQDNGSET